MQAFHNSSVFVLQYIFSWTWETLFTMILEIPSLLTYLDMPQKTQPTIIFLCGIDLSEADVL